MLSFPFRFTRLVPAIWLFLFGGIAAAVAEAPPPASAYILNLVNEPGNNDRIYAVSTGAGLYRTDNAGDFWQEITPTPKQRTYYTLKIDPNHANCLYAGGKKTGLWTSDDHGQSWQHAAMEQNTVLDVAIDPTDSSRLYVLSHEAVYRSTTGAQGPWQKVFDYPEFIAATLPVEWPEPEWGVRLSWFQYLTIDPHHPRTIFFGVRWEGGYHRSDDGGDTWRHETIGPIFRRADRILADPVTPGLLYAETHHQGLFKSHNHGRSWVSASHGIAPQKRTPYYGAVLISGMAFDPNDPTTLYAGSDYSNWKSTDAGATWQELGETLSCEFTRSFLVTEKAVYAGTNVGLFRSFDQGRTWESCNRGLPPRRILATARGTVNGESFEFAICAGRPAVYRRSLTHESDWAPVSWLLYESASAIRFDDDTETVIVTTSAGERHSRDGGLRWDVPAQTYTELAPATPKVSPEATRSTPGHRQLPLVITGSPRPDDSKLAKMYQRPPYISLEIVGENYPEDGSEPLWRGAWESQLSGVISVPQDVLESHSRLRLKVEVRDFQYGTRLGSALINQEGPTVVQVKL